MEERERLQSLLDEFAQAVGLPDANLDEDGMCTLLFDEAMTIHFQLNEPAGSLVLFSTLGTVPEEGREAFYAQMLKGNLFWQETGGATLALEESSQSAVLAYEHPLAGLEGTGFQNMVEQFVNVVEDWQDRLKQSDKAPEGSDEAGNRDVSTGLPENHLIRA